MDEQSAAAVRFNGAIPEYFHAETLREVIAARKFFLSRWDSSAEWALLFACTLHLLHGNRPYRFKPTQAPGNTSQTHRAFEYRALIPRFSTRLPGLPMRVETNLVHLRIGSGDCTTLWPISIPRADVVITSPPFYNSTRFYMSNWMRFWFVGSERVDFDMQPSSLFENRQIQDLDVYRHFFGRRECLKSLGSWCFT